MPISRRSLRLLAVLGVSTSAVALAATETWPLTPASDYIYDASTTVVSGGYARLYSSVKGTGVDGDLAVTGSTFDLSSDASGSRTVADGVSWSLSGSASSDTLTLSSAGTGLETGDEVLVVDIGGTSASPATGDWETARVASVSGSVVTLTGNLTNSYDGITHSVLVQRIPNYADVTLSNATLTTSAWNGSRGGVVAFRASGTLTVDASSEISADNLGYRGGAGGSTSGGSTTGGESVGGRDGTGGAVLANGVGGGGGGEGPTAYIGTYGGAGVH